MATNTTPATTTWNVDCYWMGKRRTIQVQAATGVDACNAWTAKRHAELPRRQWDRPGDYIIAVTQA